MGRYEALKSPSKISDFFSTGKVRIFSITALQDFRVENFDFSNEGGKVFDVERSTFCNVIVDGKYNLKSYGFGLRIPGPNYDLKSYGCVSLNVIDSWIYESQFEAVNE